jgi:outer membrane protein assembly factor BamC
MNLDFRHAVRWSALFAALAVLGACSSVSSVMEGKKVDYKSSGKLPPLEVPPDLTNPGADDRYAVPDTTTSGKASFKAYSEERSGQTLAKSSDVLPQVDKVAFHRDGSERWIEIQAPPEEVWPVVKEFWQENGFIIKIEKPQAGVMETDWAENRASIPMDPIRSVLSKVADSLYSTSERDKFRTRLEHGSGGTTEIYISHQGMYEVIQGGDNHDQTIWEPRPPDPELEAEMLRRLMVRFGVQESRAKAMMAQDTLVERATLTRNPGGHGSLAMTDAFDRAWRRVGLALDRVGFTVEDRDRSQGIYYVRYSDPEADAISKKDKGFLSKLAFWSSDSKKPQQEQYRVLLKESGDGTKVEIMDKNGQPDKSETGNKILSLLYEQLK